MDWTQIGTILVTVCTTLWGCVNQVFKWINEHQTDIQAIILRVEKEAQDGWSNLEKENLVVELFYSNLYPKLPVQMKIIYKLVNGEKYLRNIIRDFCKKSHEWKEKTVALATVKNIK
jgi:hypothetical protein